jgi:hypothetical protein
MNHCSRRGVTSLRYTLFSYYVVKVILGSLIQAIIVFIKHSMFCDSMLRRFTFLLFVLSNLFLAVLLKYFSNQLMIPSLLPQFPVLFVHSGSIADYDFCEILKWRVRR